MLDKLRIKLTEFENEDVYVEIKGALQFHITIKSAKILISNQKVFITNEKEQDFIIELYYLDNIEIEGNAIYLQMQNDIEIMLDY